MKRVLCIILVLVIVSTAFVGCGKTVPSSETSTSSATSASSAKDTSREPITLKIFGSDTEKSFTEGIQTDPVAKQIEKELGITMDVSKRTSAEQEQIMVASGDLPDLMQLFQPNYQNLVNAGMILPMDSLIDEYGADIKKNAQWAVAYSKDYLSAVNGPDKGKLFVIPGVISTGGDVGFTAAPYIRWDYYKELGYPEVNNYDDLLNVVAEMLKKHPVNEAGQKNYGFSPWFDWGAFPLHVMTGFMRGVTICEGGLLQQDSFNPTQVKDWVYDDSACIYEGLRFFNKAYRMGLMDPDALTQKYDQAIQKGSTNRILCEIVGWQQGNTNNDLEKAGFAGRGMEPLPPFKGTENYTGYNVSVWGNNDRAWMISAKTKYPERAMELINYLYSIEGAMTVHNGPKNDYWVEDNGKFKLTDKFLSAMKNDPDYKLNTGAGKYSNWPGLSGAFLAPNGQFIGIGGNKEIVIQNYTQVDKDYCQYYGVQVKGDVARKFAKNVEIKDDAKTVTPGELPSDLKLIRAKFEELSNNSFTKMVLAKDDAQLNGMIKTFRADAEKLGYKKAVDYYLKQYEEQGKNLSAFYNKIGYKK